MDNMLFENDDLVYLPIDKVIKIDVGEQIDPGSSTALPSSVVHTFIDRAEVHWVMDFCICRDANKCKDYPRDLGCLFLGEAARRIDPRLGRLVSKEEAHRHAEKARNAGLVHLIGRNKLDAVWLDVRPGERLLTICNCCPCCCLWKMIPSLTDKIGNKITKMEGVEVTVNSNCVGCGICEEVCFLRAIRIVEGKAEITDMCRGCGRCAETCPHKAIEVRTPSIEAIEHTIKRIEEVVNVR